LLKPTAAEIADQVHARIKDRFAADEKVRPLRIAIFPFGDHTGKITTDNHDLSLAVQGTLNFLVGQELSARAKGKFTLLDKFGLAREFSDAGVDPAAVSAANTELGSTLARVGIDAAVLGVIRLDDIENSRVQASVTFAGLRATNALVAPTKGVAFDQPGMSNDASQRLGMELWVRSGGTYRRAPIVTAREGSEYSDGKLYAILPRGSESAEFIIRLVNRGLTTQAAFDRIVGLRNEDFAAEQRRLFGVVLTVDGVNSFYQDLGDGQVKPVIVHPKNARKWVLSPPGFQIAPSRGAKGYELRSVQGAGHSVIDVQGYQKDDKHAMSFKFAPASKSVAAEKVGIFDEIGVINAQFYPEKLSGDQRRFASLRSTPRLGASEGPQVAQPVFRINVQFHKDPLITFKLFYRTSDDCPIPVNERLTVQEGS
jgi:hypothetical protein